MSGDSIQVGVRVRPFNKREKNKKCSLVIEMEGNTTIITDPETGEKDKFEFNYSYWSHQPGSDRDATQETLFNDLGELYLNNAWQGKIILSKLMAIR